MNTTVEAETPGALSRDERRRLVAERKRNSLWWRLVHLLGSLQLALILLSTIAIACAIATFYESAFNAKIAAAYIYKAPWFIFWLGVLCINLFAVTLTRWPWEKKHIGFITTHYGIITVLIGAVIGSRTGFEGNVTLRTDEPPLSRITTSRSILQVESPVDGALFIYPFDAGVSRPSADRPKLLPVPDSDFRIKASGFSEHLVSEDRLVPMSGSDGRPGVEIAFEGSMADTETVMPLVFGPDGGGVEEDFFGLAKVAWLPELPTYSDETIRESQMVFARWAPIVHAETDSRTGVQVSLNQDGSKVTLSSPDGVSATYPRADIDGKAIPVGGATVTIQEFWPAFELVDGKPTSAGAEPSNPAMLVEIVGPPRSSTDRSILPVLEMAPDSPGSSVKYQIVRAGVVEASGEVQPGDSIQTGWADWTATFRKIEPRAAVVSEPFPDPSLASGVPGFLARLVAPDGSEGPSKWIVSGNVSALTHEKLVVRLGYGLQLRPVPFSIRLVNFEVPRFEGTETPANFIASVEFRDLETNETKDGTARMNHPASWPGGWFAQLSGFNYKFSQAEWNPQNLNETTLQVLYDPGWFLKWFGSLMICVGIFTLFYLKPGRRKSPSPAPGL